MLAIGCFLPMVLLIVGGCAGAVIGTTTAASLWGAGAGFVIGCAGLAGMFWGFERMRNR